MPAKKILNTSAPKNDKIVTQPVQTAPVSKQTTSTVNNVPASSGKQLVADTRPYTSPNVSSTPNHTKAATPKQTVSTPTIKTTTPTLPTAIPTPSVSSIVNTPTQTATTQPSLVDNVMSVMPENVQNTYNGILDTIGQVGASVANNGIDAINWLTNNNFGNLTPAQVTQGLLDVISSIPGSAYYRRPNTQAQETEESNTITDRLNSLAGTALNAAANSGLNNLAGNGWFGVGGLLANDALTEAQNRYNNAQAVAQNAQSNSLADALYQAARDSLVYSDNPNANPNAPYMEVPNVGGSLYDSILNQTAVIPTDRATPHTAEELIAERTNSLLSNLPQFGDERTVVDVPEGGDKSNTSIISPVTTRVANEVADFADRSKGGDTTNSYSYNYNGGSSGGRLGGGNGTSGLSGFGGLDISSLYDLLNQRLAEYDSNYGNLMNSLYDLYNNNANSLSDYYQQALNALGLNFNDTQSNLADQLSNSQEALEAQRRRQLQEAYISRMMNEKNLADTLAAYGLSGGATESVLTNLRNNYNNTRNSVEENIQTSLRDLLQTYMNNLSTARQRYNENVLNTENSRVSAMNTLLSNLATQQANAMNNRTAARAGAYDDLFDTLANLYAKGYQLS
jgi:hypothetical protein